MYTLLIADDEADERILIRFLLNRSKMSSISWKPRTDARPWSCFQDAM